MPKGRPVDPTEVGRSNRPACGVSAPCQGAGKGPFDSADEAARAALNAANPDSIKENREYAGLIYRWKDGEYYYTGPVRGSDQGANGKRAPAPGGSTIVGDYHTHADYSEADPKTHASVRTGDPARDHFNSDQFSSADKASSANDAAGKPDYRSYLGTPSGKFRRYDPATGSDEIF